MPRGTLAARTLPHGVKVKGTERTVSDTTALTALGWHRSRQTRRLLTDAPTSPFAANVRRLAVDVHDNAAGASRASRARFAGLHEFRKFVGQPLYAGASTARVSEATLAPQGEFIGEPPDDQRKRPFRSSGCPFFRLLISNARTYALTAARDLSACAADSVDQDRRR